MKISVSCRWFASAPSVTPDALPVRGDKALA
jgi:hypothetical protein